MHKMEELFNYDFSIQHDVTKQRSKGKNYEKQRYHIKVEKQTRSKKLTRAGSLIFSRRKIWVEKLKSRPVLPFSGRIRIDASSSSTSHSTLSNTL